MKILVLDVETTGFDAEKDEIIEIGAVLYDIVDRPIAILSETIIPTIDVPEKIKKLTGISNEMLKKPIAVPLKNAMFRLAKITPLADFYMAHNAQFDFKFLKKAEEKAGIRLGDKPIIDTRYDLPYPEDQTNFKLNYLLADHGLFNPFAHRAAFDCMSTYMLFKQYKMDEVLHLQESPMITIRAVVSIANKDLAKNMGFRWEANKKQWLLDIKRAKYEKMKFPFETVVEFEIPF